MFKRIILVLCIALTLILSTVAVEAGCRGCGGRGFFGGRAPVRSFFRNRQPARRVVRGVARVVTAPGRVIIQRRRAIRAYRSSGRTVAVPSVPNQVVSQLGPVNEQIVSSEPMIQSQYPVYDGGHDFNNWEFQDNSYTPMSTCGPNGCN
jgi:hypothetical protein